MWFSIYALAGTPNVWRTHPYIAASPLFITFLILYVSGIPCPDAFCRRSFCSKHRASHAESFQEHGLLLLLAHVGRPPPDFQQAWKWCTGGQQVVAFHAMTYLEHSMLDVHSRSIVPLFMQVCQPWRHHMRSVTAKILPTNTTRRLPTCSSQDPRATAPNQAEPDSQD